MAAAGGLAGPAAGQSSVWYNTTFEGMDVAQTSRPAGIGSAAALGVACVASGAGVFSSVTGPRADSTAGAVGLKARTMSEVHTAFRFDGRPDTEIVLPALRIFEPGRLAIFARDTAALIPSLRSAGYAETGRPGGTWIRWSLLRAADAIDRLPCWEGDR